MERTATKTKELPQEVAEVMMTALGRGRLAALLKGNETQTYLMICGRTRMPRCSMPMTKGEAPTPE